MAPPRRPSADDSDQPEKTQANREPTASRGTGLPREDDPEAERHTMQHQKVKAKARGKLPPANVSAEYRTGSSYGLDDDPSVEGRSLEGDGLEALDPEVDGIRHTRNVPEASESGELEDPTEGGGDHTDPGPSDSQDEDADDENKTRAGPPVELEIVEGPDQGMRRKFKGVRMVIGRTAGVDLLLSDQSVSRRHIELIHGDEGVLLRDLASGNGTRLNGSKVGEKLLQHDDVIHIGKTKIRFVDTVSAFRKMKEAEDAKKAEEAKAAEGGEEAKSEEAAAEGEAKPEGESASGEVKSDAAASEASEGAENTNPDAPKEGDPKRSKTAVVRPLTSRNLPRKDGNLLERVMALEPKKRYPILAAPVVVLLLIGVLVATRKPPPPKEDPAEKQSAELMQQARDAIRAEKYEDAIGLIDKAEKLRPGVDSTKLASNARNELGAQRAVEEVRVLMTNKRFDDARTALARVPVGSVKTEEARRKLTKELDEGEKVARKERFDELMSAGDLDGAKAMLPNLADGARREAEAALADAEQRIADDQKQEQKTAAINAANVKARKDSARSEQITLAFAVVSRKFSSNEWDRAAAECDRVIDANPGDDDIRKRAKQLQQLIPNFGRNFDDGMKKFRAGQITSSAKPLRKARELYLQINLPTKVGDQLDEALAEAAVAAGREALLRSDFASAAIYYREAMRLNPEDPKAKAGMSEIAGKADELYQMAYMIRDRDPREALQQFKIVVEITPVGSTTHEKAKNQIAAMQP
jgi:pSer/pThr/pTyr-binding forkhead associated (FHA) protein